MNPDNAPRRDLPHAENLEEESPAEKVNQAIDEERIKLRNAVASLSKITTLAMADSYFTEDMGVEFLPEYREQIMAERIRLNESLGDFSRLWRELDDTLSEVQRCVGSLRYMIDPENN